MPIPPIHLLTPAPWPVPKSCVHVFVCACVCVCEAHLQMVNNRKQRSGPTPPIQRGFLHQLPQCPSCFYYSLNQLPIEATHTFPIEEFKFNSLDQHRAQQKVGRMYLLQKFDFQMLTGSLGQITVPLLERIGVPSN